MTHGSSFYEDNMEAAKRLPPSQRPDPAAHQGLLQDWGVEDYQLINMIEAVIALALLYWIWRQGHLQRVAQKVGLYWREITLFSLLGVIALKLCGFQFVPFLDLLGLPYEWALEITG